jgi:hypothetical protein
MWLVCVVAWRQVWRYYLLAVRPESSDADFVWNDFAGACLCASPLLLTLDVVLSVLAG